MNPVEHDLALRVFGYGCIVLGITLFTLAMVMLVRLMENRGPHNGQ